MDPQDTSDNLNTNPVTQDQVAPDQTQGVPNQLDPFQPTPSPDDSTPLQSDSSSALATSFDPELRTERSDVVPTQVQNSTVTNPTPPSSLLTDEQKNSLFSELGLANLPNEKKEELMTQMIDTVLNRIFSRVLPSLSKEDTQALEDMGLREDGDSAIGSYLVSKVPNLDAIAQEEVEKFRTELKTSASTIQAALPT